HPGIEPPACPDPRARLAGHVRQLVGEQDVEILSAPVALVDAEENPMRAPVETGIAVEHREPAEEDALTFELEPEQPLHLPDPVPEPLFLAPGVEPEGLGPV